MRCSSGKSDSSFRLTREPPSIPLQQSKIENPGPDSPSVPGLFQKEPGVLIRMDSDRKYRQPGYSENNGLPNSNGTGQKPKPSGPRPSLDITGPRLPRLVQTVTASRCYSC